MTTARTNAPLDESPGNAIRWINRVLEFLWLMTVVAVPLAFVDRESFLSELELAYVDVPKTVLLRSLVGLMAILWLIEWALQHRDQMEYPFTGRRLHFWPRTWLRNLLGCLRTDPTRWVTLAVLLYLSSVLLSTALSEAFSVSMWGLVPGQDTYPAYTIICYVVLFGVVAAHVKSKAQIVRLLWAIASMGVLVSGYSWAQFYGHDVFNLREIPGGQLLGSSLGNSILAGALLLMTISVSLAAATIALEQPARGWRFWSNAGVWTLILTLQITALIYASARGPWGGAVVGLVGLLGLVAASVDWRSFGRTAMVLGLAAGLSVAVILVPPPIPTGKPVQIETGHQFSAPVEASALPASAAERILSLGRDVTAVGRGVGGGGLSGRIEIWQTSGRIIAKRPWFEVETAGQPLVRHFVGYGPDMFKYTYLLERAPRGPDRVLISERFAHNFLIHQGVELGFFGLLTSLGLFAAPLIVGGCQLFHRMRGHSTFHKLVLVGILAALAGRFAEQMVGVGAVSDLTIFWVLLGIFVALPTSAGASQAGPSSGTTVRQGRQPSSRHTLAGRRKLYGAQLVSAVVAVCLIAGIGALTWAKSINYIWAGFEARDGLNSLRETEFESALVALDRAIDLAPDVFVYHTLRAAVYEGYRRQEQGPREPDCDRSSGSTPYEVCLARVGYLSLVEAAKQRPFDWRPRLNLADTGRKLALLERDPNMASEAISLYHEVAQLDPQAWWHWEWLAAASINVGQYEAALEPLEKSLALLDGTPRAALSRLLQGMAYLGLDEPATALRSLDEAIRLNPKLADAYANRGASYNGLGEYQRAIRDLDEAINQNPEMAMAYNNRGNSYGNLDQLERAIEDYGEAIRLDPRFALAYSNRALAYTYMSRDDDAEADVERGTELGLDPELLLAKILEARNAR